MDHLSAILLLSDRHGIYIPSMFVTNFDVSKYDGIRPEDVTDCLDPASEAYWDAWDGILSRASFTTPEGHRYHLHQDGDLWAVCPELMTDDEYQSFFGESRDEVKND